MLKVACCLCLAVTACGSSSESGSAAGSRAAGRPPAPAATRKADASLFERLGGRPAIEAVVNEFVGRTTTDPRIKERFFNTDATHLKKMLVEQVCAATGGPCTYSGRDMKSSHGGMEVVEEEWNALVEDLVAALDKFKVPAREKGELLGALGGLKPQIVARPADLRPVPPERLAPAAELGLRLDDRGARDLMAMAVVAAGRGQRSYAEQLFSRAELRVGPRALAAAAPVFRAEAPPRVTTALHKMPADTPPQPKGAVGSSDEDDPSGPARSALSGSVRVGGAALDGMGVVMLEPASGHFKRRVKKQRIIEQRGREFAPHVMAVPVGSTISFPNFDPFFHNVFSLSSAAAFDLGLYASGDTREVTFTREGIVRLGCNLHSKMAAFIIVVSAPHYAVTDGSGNFSFRRLSPGRYKVKAWSERSAAPSVSEVTIKPGANRLTIALEQAAPSDNVDKFGRAR
jgi:hemoglobin